MLHVLLDGPPDGPLVMLSGDAAHHVGRVKRAKVGEPVTAADGCGGRYTGRVARATPDEGLPEPPAAGREPGPARAPWHRRAAGGPFGPGTRRRLGPSRPGGVGRSGGHAGDAGPDDAAGRGGAAGGGRRMAPALRHA